MHLDILWIVQHLKKSHLYSVKKKAHEAGQVICDLFRCSILSGLFVPGALIPVAKPLGKWFGADDVILKMGVDYLIVLLGGSTISYLFLMFCGFLQAEGRTFFVSIAQISSFIMNMAIFCPWKRFQLYLRKRIDLSSRIARCCRI